MRGGRLAWIVAGLVALYVLARVLGIGAYVTPERLRPLVHEAGPWGPLAFAAVFTSGVLLQVPGLVFVSASPLLFPAEQAWLWSLLAGNLAVNLNFLIVRRLGGSNSLQLSMPWARRAFDQLQRRPLRSVLVLRVVFSMFPPLTGALALTSVRARDHALATALGLLVPISAVVWFEAVVLG